MESQAVLLFLIMKNYLGRASSLRIFLVLGTTTTMLRGGFQIDLPRSSEPIVISPDVTRRHSLCTTFVPNNALHAF